MMDTYSSVVQASLATIRDRADSPYTEALSSEHGQNFIDTLGDPGIIRMAANVVSEPDIAVSDIETPDPSEPSGFNCWTGPAEGPQTAEQLIEVANCLVFGTSLLWYHDKDNPGEVAANYWELFSRPKFKDWTKINNDIKLGDDKCSDRGFSKYVYFGSPTAACLRHDIGYNLLKRADKMLADGPPQDWPDDATFEIENSTYTGVPQYWTPRNKHLADRQFFREVKYIYINIYGNDQDTADDRATTMFKGVSTIFWAEKVGPVSAEDKQHAETSRTYMVCPMTQIVNQSFTQHGSDIHVSWENIHGCVNTLKIDLDVFTSIFVDNALNFSDDLQFGRATVDDAIVDDLYDNTYKFVWRPKYHSYSNRAYEEQIEKEGFTQEASIAIDSIVVDDTELSVGEKAKITADVSLRPHATGMYVWESRCGDAVDWKQIEDKWETPNSSAKYPLTITKNAATICSFRLRGTLKEWDAVPGDEVFVLSDEVTVSWTGPAVTPTVTPTPSPTPTPTATPSLTPVSYTHLTLPTKRIV